jgi:hypothetical protein
MSWLSNLFSKNTVIKLEQAEEAVAAAMPSVQCAAAATEGPAAEDQDIAEHDDNPTRQRRYFVKTGTYIDNEEELTAARKANNSAELIADRAPVHLKTVFPKLSLR